MPEIKRLQNVVATLRARAARSIRDDNVSVVVGYTAAYAAAVHEKIPAEPQWGRDRTGYHPDGSEKKGTYWSPEGRGGPKFLEAPAREMNNDGTFKKIIQGIAGAGKTLAQALLACGLALQRASQLRVPVDTGNLKASAFTRLEQGRTDLGAYREIT